MSERKEWICPKCGWTEKAHPTYGWSSLNDGAVEVHKTQLCPKGMEPGLFCFRCKRTPSEIQEYVNEAKRFKTTPEDFVKYDEGTYNSSNEHFCCTDCYIAIGMPSSASGWVAP